MLGLNIVEFSGDDEDEINHLTTSLCQRLDELMASHQAGVIGHQVCHDLMTSTVFTICVKKRLVY